MLESGAPAQGHLVRVRPKGAPGPEYLFSVSVSRLESPREGSGLLAEMLDVTEREKVSARVHVYGAVRQYVGQTLNVVTTCEELVRELVPGVADIAVVEVVDAGGPCVRTLRRPAATGGAAAPCRRLSQWRRGADSGASGG